MTMPAAPAIEAARPAKRKLAPSIQERIGAHFEALSPQLKIAARFVAEHPHRIAMRSLRQIASEAGLTPPTLSRLARAVGCADYEALRDICRQETTRRSQTYADKAKQLQARGEGESLHEPGGLIRRQAAAAVANIEMLLASVDARKLELAAGILSRSDRVLLVGSLSSTAFADYAGYMANMAFANWEVAGQSGVSLPAAFIDLGRRDTVLVLTKSPYARRSIEAARIAKAAGAKVIAITDGVHSPVIAFATISFIVCTESPNFFPSHAATLVLFEALIGMVVRGGGKKAQSRIAAIESANRSNGEYWQR